MVRSFLPLHARRGEAGPEQVSTSTYLTAPKGSQGRRVDLMRATILSLRAHRSKEMRRRRRAGLPPLKPGDFVFCRAACEPLDPSQTTKRFLKLSREGGFTRIRLHDLRHTHASHLLQAGGNIKAVQERLGHADPMFTIDTYIHMMPTIQAEAVKALAEFYGIVATRSPRQ